mmetsp:Transcript_64585/g.129781  ORF Transcript_64585/g.129781 Transcript_64585/m.129781 type:complete len:183 (-) Transcript_64585:59-607(-)
MDDDSLTSKVHYQQFAWQQRIGEEIRTKLRLSRWHRGDRHAFEDHQVSPLCDFRRTLSQPTFVKPLEEAEVLLPKLGLSTAALPGKTKSFLRGPRRTPTPWPCASPAASAPRSSSSASRLMQSRGQDRGPSAPTRSMYQTLQTGGQDEVARALRPYAEEEQRVLRETRRKLQASLPEANRTA